VERVGLLRDGEGGGWWLVGGGLWRRWLVGGGWSEVAGRSWLIESRD